jgi:hypothetical protein
MAWDSSHNACPLRVKACLKGGRAASQYELPLGWNGLLPLVADLFEKLHDL